MVGLGSAALHDRTGSYDAAFTCFAVLNLAVLFLVLLVRRELPQTRASA